MEKEEIKVGPMKIIPKTFEEWIHSIPSGSFLEIKEISNGTLLKCETLNEAYLLVKD